MEEAHSLLDAPKKVSKCGQCAGFILPGIVVMLVLFGAGAFVVFLSVRAAGFAVLQVLVTVFLLAGVGMTLWSFYRAVFSDPGSPPPEDEWLGLPYYRGRPLEPVATESTEIRVDRMERRVRYCRHCHQHKPDRAHHCRQLQRCVLRMDHFCPWVNNAVGMRNHKFFVLFCFWCAVLCSYGFVSIVSLISVFSSWDMSLWGGIDVLACVVGFYSAIFGATLWGFGGFHMWLVLRNQTTLEQMRDDRRWDTGSKRDNWVEVFGTRHWFLPIDSSNVVDGVVWNGRNNHNDKDDV